MPGDTASRQSVNVDGKQFVESPAEAAISEKSPTFKPPRRINPVHSTSFALPNPQSAILRTWSKTTSRLDSEHEGHSAASRNRRGSPQPRSVSQKPLLIQPTSAPPRGRHITAQGRDPRERTLGQRAARRRTLKGFHTGREQVDNPFRVGLTGLHFPGCAPASRPWAVMGNPFGVQRPSGHQDIAERERILSRYADFNGLQCSAVQCGGSQETLDGDLCFLRDLRVQFLSGNREVIVPQVLRLDGP